MNQEERKEWYATKSDMDIAKHINLALLMCGGIREHDAGFDTIVSINETGLKVVARIIGNVRHTAPTPVGAA